MKYTQLLIHELGRECNLALTHTKCPSGDLDRYGQLDTSRELDDDTVVQDLKIGYAEGFQGMAAFHYYNEPLMQFARLKYLVPRIKAEIPGARVLLWTNGTHIGKSVDPQELRIFDSIRLSNYFKKDWAWLREIVPDLHILSGVLDSRKSMGRLSQHGCLRPYNELIVDNYGNGHICCADYQGTIHLGNVFKEGYRHIIEQYIMWREKLAEDFPSELPPVCQRCAIRTHAIGRIIEEPFQLAREKLGL